MDHSHSFSEKNNELKELSKNRHIKYIYLGNLPLVRKYISLVASLRRLNPDLIINNYNAPTQYVLPFLKKKTKIVHVLHNNTDDFYRVASINARHVNRWIAPTPAIADYFNKYTEYKYRDRISVIPHGVHLPDNPPQKKHNRLQLILSAYYTNIKASRFFLKLLNAFWIRNMISFLRLSAMEYCARIWKPRCRMKLPTIM